MRTVMRMDERAQQLRRARTPFVHATVVRAAPPTSAHPGDEAILLSDGTIEGFVGGHCAQNSVRKAAMGALQTNESVLLRVLPDGSPAESSVSRTLMSHGSVKTAPSGDVEALTSTMSQTHDDVGPRGPLDGDPSSSRTHDRTDDEGEERA